jgi:hypothetical protein
MGRFSQAATYRNWNYSNPFVCPRNRVIMAEAGPAVQKMSLQMANRR